MTVKNNTVPEWMKEVSMRLEKVKAALSTGSEEAACRQANELQAAAAILRDELEVIRIPK
ncbi:hypothetical protein [Burkholderia cepacia]|uniref:hypothetical protein n=1 Tax=Burkholderia cepacia TaxID=292 RepID=UPI00075884E3|nr:hypothetical protein [Burkholderia cepacia]